MFSNRPQIMSEFKGARQIAQEKLLQSVTAPPSLKDFTTGNRRDFVWQIGSAFAAGMTAFLLPRRARAQDDLPPAPIPMRVVDQPKEPKKLEKLILTDTTQFKRPTPTKNVRKELVDGFDELNGDVRRVWIGMEVVFEQHGEASKVIDQLKRSQQDLKLEIAELWEGFREHQKQINDLLDFCLKVKENIALLGKELCRTQGMLNQLQCMIQTALCMACGLGDRIRKARMVSFLFGLALGVGIGVGVGGGGGGALSATVW